MIESKRRKIYAQGRRIGYVGSDNISRLETFAYWKIRGGWLEGASLRTALSIVQALMANRGLTQKRIAAEIEWILEEGEAARRWRAINRTGPTAA